MVKVLTNGKFQWALNKLILQIGGFRLFASYAHSGATLVACGLLTLKTKHFGHRFSSCC